MAALPDHNVPDPGILDLLSPYAWQLVERYDIRASTLYFGEVADVEEYLRSRYEFVLRVLCDIASLPSVAVTT